MTLLSCLSGEVLSFLSGVLSGAVWDAIKSLLVKPIYQKIKVFFSSQSSGEEFIDALTDREYNTNTNTEEIIKRIYLSIEGRKCPEELIDEIKDVISDNEDALRNIFYSSKSANAITTGDITAICGSTVNVRISS